MSSLSDALPEKESSSEQCAQSCVRFEPGPDDAATPAELWLGPDAVTGPPRDDRAASVDIG